MTHTLTLMCCLVGLCALACAQGNPSISQDATSKETPSSSPTKTTPASTTAPATTTPPAATAPMAAGSIDCRKPETWPEAWAAEEAAVIAQVNIERSKGASCGSKGTFAPAPPVTMNRELQIAARCHSIDMVERGGLDHTGTDGSEFFERVKREGYKGYTAGENIAAGSSTGTATVAQWMKSEGHCSNIMVPGVVHMGIGYFTGDVVYTHYWTMVTGVNK